ncbi:MAG: DUF4080 domain-containing protein [Gammaproteobacteria bacterium]|nr:DUF4080 domain-containing protein [Gammaproteobacteria bacterium]MBT3725520.1 DUF4080 domain-containing protein [Gammaproteobacteria bacterium]MBT4076305.1 DUF4080 domain-containing protein [Gammaproteobacteria bacterium]MBT4194679.1 DUF4080 domain-containing protein [Gammaproteobacteria bacterium]MBT4452324.1 DUF4080 domain-containing protein [Gammaproteobacteria bacterium]
MIVLCTLNARYIHSSLGLRYLYANMEELQDQTEIMEFMINQRPIDIAENILNKNPSIVGMGIYIWNIQQSTEVISILKALKPDIKIILGGPEISYETEESPAYPYADFILRGQADLDLKLLCQDIINNKPILNKIIDSTPFHPKDIKLPYIFYTDEDIRQRVLYVEASRGCPFKCEFCLSALDKTSQAFDIDEFLHEMDELYLRGARHFKFVDRTFNLNIKTSQKILNFFLQKPLHDLFLHFELIPDRLPEELKDLIQKFPAGALQFEIGIQTFNPEIQQIISRKQDHQKTIENLEYLFTQTEVHLHTDLIAGLPGEDIQSFAKGFDLLVSLKAQEIQMGILKRLRGTPIIRHSKDYGMIFNPTPPYTVLSTAHMDSKTLFRINRFARYWDMIANSGRFSNTLPEILSDNSFNNFMALSDWLFETTGQTHKLALPRLFKLIYQHYDSSESITKHLEIDFNKTGIKSLFSSVIGETQLNTKTGQVASSRQQRHLN